MTSQCFLLDVHEGKTRLYMSQISTTQALDFFDPNEPIQIIEFGASVQGGNAWLTAKDLPRLDSIGALRAYLIANEHLDLVDLSVRMGAHAELSTHDDGEAHFVFPNDEAAFQVVRRVLTSAQATTVIEALVANRGQYVVIRKAGVCIFQTFEQYLRNGA